MQQTRSYNSILSIFQLRQCFLNRPNPASFCLFLIFSQDNYSTNLTINDKSIDGVFGTQTWDGRMVGAEESAELWRHQCFLYENWIWFIWSLKRIRVLRPLAGHEPPASKFRKLFGCLLPHLLLSHSSILAKFVCQRIAKNTKHGTQKLLSKPWDRASVIKLISLHKL